jgi:hypothetical protein
MLTVGASRVATRYQEQRRGTLDHDAPDVLGPSNAAALFDLEPEALEGGHLTAELRRLVLALATLCESLGLDAALSVVHHRLRT